MNKTKRKSLSLLLSFAVGFTMIFGSAGFAQAASYDKTKAIFEKCGDYIYTTVKEPTVGTLGGEWVMYGLSHAGYAMSDNYRDTYLANVEKELKEKDGILHAKAFTQYSRVIIGVTSAGADATNIAGYNIVEPLADFVNVKWLGMNSVMWALIALAPYSKQAKVKKAIDRAIFYLSEQQNETGGFTFWGTDNSESCAQAICGLLACGVNPNTDKRFVKNGKSIVDALLTFHDEKTGGFRHVNKASGGFQPVVDQMATEQAYYALAFFYKSVPDKAALTKAAKAGSGKLKVTWKKAAINTDYVTKQSGKTAAVSGYQIVCATDKKFTKNVVKTTVSGKNLTKTVTGLKKGKTYYVKLRAYKTVNGKKIYGQYSSVRTQKV